MTNAQLKSSQFISRQEACQRLGLSLSTLKRRIADKSIPHVRLGRRILIPENSLQLLAQIAIEGAQKQEFKEEI